MHQAPTAGLVRSSNRRRRRFPGPVAAGLERVGCTRLRQRRKPSRRARVRGEMGHTGRQGMGRSGARMGMSLTALALAGVVVSGQQVPSPPPAPAPPGARGAGAPVAPSPSPAAIERAGQVLAATRQALGGDTLAAVKTLVINGRTRRVRGNNLVPIEFETSLELPDKYLRRVAGRGNGFRRSTASTATTSSSYLRRPRSPCR